MAFLLGSFFGRLLDPFSFIPALVIAYLIKKWWLIPVAGIVIAVCIEALLASMSVVRQFGDSLVLGFIVSNIHVSLAFLATQKFKSRRVNSVSKKGLPNIADQEEAEDLGAEFQTTQERMSGNLGVMLDNMDNASDKIYAAVMSGMKTVRSIGEVVLDKVKQADLGDRFKDVVAKISKPGPTIEEKLAELQDLRDRGIITDDELAHGRKSIISQG